MRDLLVAVFVGGSRCGGSSSWGVEVMFGGLLLDLGLFIGATIPCVCSGLWCLDRGCW